MGFTEQEKEQLRQIIREEVTAALTVTVKPDDLPRLSVGMEKTETELNAIHPQNLAR